MARYKQVYNEELQKHQLVPIDESAFKREGAALHTAFEPFVSPVDGSVISDRKALREHNARNNVVQTSEFGTEHWDIKRKERERLYRGEHTPQEQLARKQELWERIQQSERQG